MSYTTIKNPKWSNPEQTTIDCEVNFNHLNEEFVPFTANPNDIYPYCKEIFDRCVSGEFGPVAPYSPPEGSFIPVVDVSPNTGV